jgi:hypothetical protein
MTERIVDALRSLRTNPPQPAASFGNCIGHIDNSALCWELVGELREQFDQEIFPKVRSHLETIFESGQRGECLTISVYLIGKAEKSARPTLLFISRCSRTRKDARAAIRNSNILSPFPAFKTAEIARDPGLAAVCAGPNVSRPSRNLIPQAMELLASNSRISSEESALQPTATAEIFYDRSKPLRRYGQDILVRNGTKLRAATANLVRIDQRMYLQTVYHAFSEPSHLLGNHEAAPDFDNEFDMDSDSEGEEDTDEDSLIAITSTASRSSESLVGSLSSDDDLTGHASHWTAPLPTKTEVCTSTSRDGSDDREVSVRSASYEYQTADCNISPVASLGQLGVLWNYSINNDWALIDLTDEVLIAYLFIELQLHTDTLLAFEKIAPSPRKKTDTVTMTVSEDMLIGTMTGTSTHICLPGSTMFLEAYRVQLDGVLSYGDCGAVVLDAASGKTYGHIIAGNRASAIAYIVGAHQVAADFQKIKSSPQVASLSMLLPSQSVYSGLPDRQSHAGSAHCSTCSTMELWLATDRNLEAHKKLCHQAHLQLMRRAQYQDSVQIGSERYTELLARVAAALHSDFQRTSHDLTSTDLVRRRRRFSGKRNSLNKFFDESTRKTIDIAATKYRLQNSTHRITSKRYLGP